MVDGSLVVDRLEAVGEPVKHASGAVLFDQGQPGVGAYVLESGSTRMSRLDNEGVPVWSADGETGFDPRTAINSWAHPAQSPRHSRWASGTRLCAATQAGRANAAGHDGWHRAAESSQRGTG